MARKTKVVVVCDRHRGEVEAVSTVEIAVGDDRKRIDVCAEHLAEFRKAMRPWLGRAATRSAPARGTKKRGSASRRPRSAAAETAAIRAWARDNGYEIAERGRIPAAVRQAYSAKR